MNTVLEELKGALGHLVKAKEKLDQEPPSRGVYNAHFGVRVATNHVRFALGELDKQKEKEYGQ